MTPFGRTLLPVDELHAHVASWFPHDSDHATLVADHLDALGAQEDDTAAFGFAATLPLFETEAGRREFLDAYVQHYPQGTRAYEIAVELADLLFGAGVIA
ncbi:hypothetical protein [Nocardia aurea]|uniref:hypothetical protein n=1 Tax=Nocardia aurea TaxID=2144174 RepID=UPI0033B1C494